MSEAAFRKLNADLARCLELADRQWDIDFLHDLGKRLEKWQHSTTISERQWEQIERIKEKYL